MGRKITMTGKNAQYIERRGANATSDNDREIYMEGDEAVYQEYAYGQHHQARQEEETTEDATKNYQKEAARKLLMDNAEYVEPIVATPEYANATPQPVEVANEKKLNYQSPTIVLQRMLEEDWFDKRSTNKELYNKEWRSKLVSDLMASEHGAYIAKHWVHDDKRLTIKGRLIGTLVGAGVLEKNMTAIARAFYGFSDNTRDKDEKREVNTFGKYIGDWKKEPYADWVKDYVDKTAQKK